MFATTSPRQPPMVDSESSDDDGDNDGSAVAGASATVSAPAVPLPPYSLLAPQTPSVEALFVASAAGTRAPTSIAPALLSQTSSASFFVPGGVDVSSDDSSDDNDNTGPTAQPTIPAAAADAAPARSPSASCSAAALGASAPAVAKRKKRVIVNTSRCRYTVVADAAHRRGWLVEDEGARSTAAASAELAAMSAEQLVKTLRKGRYHPQEACTIYWHDMSVLLPRVAQLRCWQRINHFPSMTVICRKMALAVQLSRMRHLFPAAYDFFPRSWSLRSDWPQLCSYFTSLRKPKTFILKPSSGCQGRGIVLTRNPVKAAASLPDRDYTVQLYIHRPLLIDAKKFDMRVYVLVTSVINFTAFVHTEGLVRIASREYVKPSRHNLNNARMHLTNYAVNKDDEAFESNDDGGESGDVGNKRDFTFLERFVNAELAHLAEPGAAASTQNSDEEEEDDGDDGAATAGDGKAAPPPSHSDNNGGDEEEARDDSGNPQRVTPASAAPPRRRAKQPRSSSATANSTPAVGLTPWQVLWARIDKAMVLTILSAIHELRQAYGSANSGLRDCKCDARTCFELLGFDVLVTERGAPFVLEVNHSPSLFTDTPLDTRVKDRVIGDVYRQLDPYLVDVRRSTDYHYARQVLAKQGLAPGSGLSSASSAAAATAAGTPGAQPQPTAESRPVPRLHNGAFCEPVAAGSRFRRLFPRPTIPFSAPPTPDAALASLYDDVFDATLPAGGTTAVVTSTSAAAARTRDSDAAAAAGSAAAAAAVRSSVSSGARRERAGAGGTAVAAGVLPPATAASAARRASASGDGAAAPPPSGGAAPSGAAGKRRATTTGAAGAVGAAGASRCDAPSAALSASPSGGGGVRSDRAAEGAGGFGAQRAVSMRTPGTPAAAAAAAASARAAPLLAAPPRAAAASPVVAGSVAGVRMPPLGALPAALAGGGTFAAAPPNAGGLQPSRPRPIVPAAPSVQFHMLSRNAA